MNNEAYIDNMNIHWNNFLEEAKTNSIVKHVDFNQWYKGSNTGQLPNLCTCGSYSLSGIHFPNCPLYWKEPALSDVVDLSGVEFDREEMLKINIDEPSLIFQKPRPWIKKIDTYCLEAGITPEVLIESHKTLVMGRKLMDYMRDEKACVKSLKSIFDEVLGIITTKQPNSTKE